MDYQWYAGASEADLWHDLQLSATIYSFECLESERENLAILCCTGSCVRFGERIHRTWNVLTGIRFMTAIRSCIPESTESTDNRPRDLYRLMWFTWKFLVSLLYEHKCLCYEMLSFRNNFLPECSIVFVLWNTRCSYYWNLCNGDELLFMLNFALFF